MVYNLAIIGFGTVGQGLARILVNKKDLLERNNNFKFKVVAISDIIKGTVIDQNGLNLAKFLQDVQKEGKISGIKKSDFSSVEIIENSAVNIVVETTWTNLETGEPGLTHIKKALALGKHVVTTNKGPIALAYNELSKIAKVHNAFLGFEGTVLSGTPAINLALRNLAGASVKTIRGILNSTTNYILTQMETGTTYRNALKRAQTLGYAEADPKMDVEAYDAAAKTTILANVVMNGNIKVTDVIRKGITDITVHDIRTANLKRKKIKLIAKVWRENGRIQGQVSPKALSSTDILANINGTLNALTYSTDLLNDVTVIGRGAGGIEAGYALLSDMLALNQKLIKNF
jgi:homoserine dehydrogenase